jgi:hypothetical protein
MKCLRCPSSLLFLHNCGRVAVHYCRGCGATYHVPLEKNR